MKIILPFEPYPSPRPRFRNTGKFTQTYMPSAYTKHKELIVEFVKPHLARAKFSPFTGPLSMSITFYMAIPKSYPNKKKEALNNSWHTKKPDTDNLIKTYKDALNELVYVDDSQICFYPEVKKIYSDQPRVEIEIKELI